MEELPQKYRVNLREASKHFSDVKDITTLELAGSCAYRVRKTDQNAQAGSSMILENSKQHLRNLYQNAKIYAPSIFQVRVYAAFARLTIKHSEQNRP